MSCASGQACHLTCTKFILNPVFTRALDVSLLQAL